MNTAHPGDNPPPSSHSCTQRQNYSPTHGTGHRSFKLYFCLDRRSPSRRRRRQASDPFAKASRSSRRSACSCCKTWKRRKRCCSSDRGARTTRLDEKTAWLLQVCTSLKALGWCGSVSKRTLASWKFSEIPIIFSSKPYEKLIMLPYNTGQIDLIE